MGQRSTCSFPGLINHHHKFIISFAEDEAGNHTLIKSVLFAHRMGRIKCVLVDNILSMLSVLIFGQQGIW